MKKIIVVSLCFAVFGCAGADQGNAPNVEQDSLDTLAGRPAPRASLSVQPLAADGGVTRAQVYTVHQPRTLPSSVGTFTVAAACASPNDILLSGSCVTDDPFTAPIESGDYVEGSSTDPESFQCKFKIEWGGRTHSSQAVARCLQGQ